jgi:phage shock protein A/DNA-binding XRE family transcriptional regulator
MGYQLRVHREIRDRLTGLRAGEPELARLVGEAVLALLDAGESLGPPLVVPLESVLRPPDDPREALDYSYQRQLESLTKVRRGVADVATSHKRIELQAATLERQAGKLAGQRERSMEAGRADLAREAQMREAGVQEQLARLREQLLILIGEEEKLTTASQRLQAKVEAFRVQKETLKATYTAAEASQTVREAFALTGTDTDDPEAVQADVPARFTSATSTAAEILQEIRDLTPPFPVPGPDEAGIQPPPGLMELRPGAPDDARAGLLFAVEPPGTAVLVAWVDHPGGPPDSYRDVIELAAGRLPPAGTSPPADFISYNAESLLDEFFPGEETEVEVGAGALVARDRAHTLAEARQRMRLTQAQVAERMNVRQERVSAIERAEPGATEVRTLAAYVRALGGSLEIVADVGGERIVLR